MIVHGIKRMDWLKEKARRVRSRFCYVLCYPIMFPRIEVDLAPALPSQL